MKHDAGRQLGPKIPKLSCWGSISGAPLEKAVEGNRGRWCGGTCEVVTAVW